MGSLGWRELLIVLFIAVLLFGAKKLPDLAKGVGKSIREFKKASTSTADDDDDEKESDATETPKAAKKTASADVSSKN